MWAKYKQPGFTIVELLIVIVVIGVLAAITVVAYNGIQNRSRASAASSALSQASKKIKLYLVDNPSASPDCAAFYTLITTKTDSTACSFSDTSGTNYQYSKGAADAYCITATVGNVSYTINESTQPTLGGCAGHGQNGQNTIINLATNPSLESNITGWAVANWQNGNGNVTRDTATASSGTASYKMAWTVASTVNNAGFITPYSAVTAGTSYVFSVYVRPSVSTTIIPNIRQTTGANGGGTMFDTVNPTYIAAPANTWTRISMPITISSGYVSAAFRIGVNYVPAIGDTFAGDGFMVTQGTSTYNYADGNSPNWAWDSAVNNSISTGVPL